MPPWVLRELLYRLYWTWLALICRSPWRTTTWPLRVTMPLAPTVALSVEMLTLPPPAAGGLRARGARACAPPEPCALLESCVSGGVDSAGALICCCAGVLAVGGSSARKSEAAPPNDSRAAVQNGLQRGIWGGIIMAECLRTMRDSRSCRGGWRGISPCVPPGSSALP